MPGRLEPASPTKSEQNDPSARRVSITKAFVATSSADRHSACLERFPFSRGAVSCSARPPRDSQAARTTPLFGPQLSVGMRPKGRGEGEGEGWGWVRRAGWGWGECVTRSGRPVLARCQSEGALAAGTSLERSRPKNGAVALPPRSGFPRTEGQAFQAFPSTEGQAFPCTEGQASPALKVRLFPALRGKFSTH